MIPCPAPDLNLTIKEPQVTIWAINVSIYMNIRHGFYWNVLARMFLFITIVKENS